MLEYQKIIGKLGLHTFIISTYIPSIMQDKEIPKNG